MLMRRPLDRIYAADFIGVGQVHSETKPQVILDFQSGDLKFHLHTDEFKCASNGTRL